MMAYSGDESEHGLTRYRGLWLAVLAVAGCASEPSADAQNPFNFCIEKGLEQGTSDFDACVNTRIAQLCTEAGYAEASGAYGQCVEQLHKDAFVRQQLQMRGF